MLKLNERINVLDYDINPYNTKVVNGQLLNKENTEIITKFGFRKYKVLKPIKCHSYKKDDIIYCLHWNGDNNYYFSHNKENDNYFDEALQLKEFRNHFKQIYN